VRRVRPEAREAARGPFAEIQATARALWGGVDAKRTAFGKTKIGDAASTVPEQLTEQVLPKLSDISADVGAAAQRIEQLRRFLKFAASRPRVARMQWSSLEADLRPGHARKNADGDVFIETVCFLTEKTKDEAAPENGSGGRKEPAKETPRILLNYHGTIFDHRHLIVGQLPRPNLFPCVFVRPDDLDWWFPQKIIRIKQTGGVAFVCHARFGNPGALGHIAQKSILWSGKLLVHAFESEPPEVKQVLSSADLDELVATCGSAAHHGPVPITRHDPSLKAVVETPGKGEVPVVVTSMHVIHGDFPMVLSWEGTSPVSFEVRQTPRDHVVAEGAVSPGTHVKIVGKGTRVSPAEDLKVVELAGDGIYRVRSWANRKPVLDPGLEFWLLIGKEYRRSAASGSSEGKVQRKVPPPFEKRAGPLRRRVVPAGD
jgi:hypothetical protein